MEILGLGAVAIDDLLHLDAYPPANGKVRVLRRERRVGGLTANALLAAARLGAACGYAGVLGDDEPSRFVLAEFRRSGIDTSRTTIFPGAGPAHSTILIGRDDGTRTVLSDRSAVVEPGTDRPEAALIRGLRVLLVDHAAVPAGLRAAAIAREAGIPVVADIERESHPDLGKLLDRADHLIVGEGFGRRWSGADSPEEAARRLWRDDRSVVVVTCGERGGWVLDADGARPYAADPVATADSTGCGDVFHGAYAAALARGEPLAERIRLASAVAAIRAERADDAAAFADESRVRRFLQERGDA